MYIYLLERHDQPVHDTDPLSLVVVAQTPKQARTIAQGATGGNAWASASLKNLGTARRGVRQGIANKT